MTDGRSVDENDFLELLKATFQRSLFCQEMNGQRVWVAVGTPSNEGCKCIYSEGPFIRFPYEILDFGLSGVM